MKKYFFLALVLLVQVLWLSISSWQRSQEIAHNPTLRFKCELGDPRDFLRGDYINLRMNEYIPSSKVRLNKEESYGAFSSYSPLGVFSENEKGEAVLDYVIKKEDFSHVEKEGQQAMPIYSCSMRYVPKGSGVKEPEGIEEKRRYYELLGDEKEAKDVVFDVSILSWDARRFYVPESTGELASLWRKFYPDYPLQGNIELEAELVLRGVERTPLVKQVYVNGLPYNEAVARIKSRQWEVKTPTIQEIREKNKLEREQKDKVQKDAQQDKGILEEDGHGSEEEME